MIGDWVEEAACIRFDPRLFDGLTLEDRLTAVDICAGCPVIEQCKADASRRGFGLRATEQVRAGLWWNTRGNPQTVTPALPEPTSIPQLRIECAGHVGSRHRWMTGTCREDGCRRTNQLYEAAYYARRRALRSTQAA